MKYIEMLEDVGSEWLKGEIYCINKKVTTKNKFKYTGSLVAGAFVHAGKAKFIDEPIEPEVKPKTKTIKTKKKDVSLDVESNSIINEENNN